MARFAVGLAWGHLAKLELEFMETAIGALAEINDAVLRAAASFHLERGPEPIDQSPRGAYSLFSQVVLPPTLPNSLKGLSRATERWITPIIAPNRPIVTRYPARILTVASRRRPGRLMCESVCLKPGHALDYVTSPTLGRTRPTYARAGPPATSWKSPMLHRTDSTHR